jgi:hypothetical protein
MFDNQPFRASKALYAVELCRMTRRQSLTILRHEQRHVLYHYEIPAVWFKRRKGSDTANIGTLWAFGREQYDPTDTQDVDRFLRLMLTDGRYGASCRSRWDGERLWSEPSVTHAQQQSDHAFLSGMLGQYPAIPVGYNGWWAFKEGRK